MHFVEEIEAEVAVFKKKLKRLRQFKGRGTELISLYLPPAVDRSLVMSQLTEEISQAANIKSQITRKNVQGALRKVINYLKQIDFKLPQAGLAVFCGNISGQEGKSDIKLFVLKPVQELKTRLYWCDSSFHLTPLEEMIKSADAFGIIALDKRECTIALLAGKKYDIVAKLTSGVAGKQRAGGQSAARFERLREEAEKDFFKRVSERANKILLDYGDRLKGIIVAGPGITKNEFLEQQILHYDLRKKVLGTIDISYTDESGIREAVQKSEELLKDEEITKERTALNRFFTEVVKNGLVAYGQKEVEETISMGKAETILLSEAIEWIVVKTQCSSCNELDEEVVKEPEKFDLNKKNCKKCGSSKIELLEEIDYIDWISEKAKAIGAKVRIISVETSEGEQFFQSFSGIGAFLRYK